MEINIGNDIALGPTIHIYYSRPSHLSSFFLQNIVYLKLNKYCFIYMGLAIIKKYQFLSIRGIDMFCN